MKKSLGKGKEKVAKVLGEMKGKTIDARKMKNPLEKKEIEMKMPNKGKK